MKVQIIIYFYVADRAMFIKDKPLVELLKRLLKKPQNCFKYI